MTRIDTQTCHLIPSRIGELSARGISLGVACESHRTRAGGGRQPHAACGAGARVPASSSLPACFMLAASCLPACLQCVLVISHFSREQHFQAFASALRLELPAEEEVQATRGPQPFHLPGGQGYR